MNLYAIFAEAVLLASALSIDAFIACFAYGSNQIKIPAKSIQIINIICSIIFGISLLGGTWVRQYIPGRLTTLICFVILLVLGLVKLLDGITKSIITKYSGLKKQLKFSMFNFRFVLNLYANPEAADIDRSKSISPSEAASLAIALSLDGMAVGFGAAIGDINILAVFLCSVAANAVAIVLGLYTGQRVAKKLPFNIAWLSGAVLIIMAVVKLFS